MQDEPSAEELLRVARETLRRKLIAALPERNRLDALIIANVMAIAAREAAFGEQPLRHELARLSALFGEGPPPGDDRAEVSDAVDRLSRRLSAALREGMFEGDSVRMDQVKAHLIETTLQKLRVNNPRYLEVEGLG
jgi:hypothetical protein